MSKKDNKIKPRDPIHRIHDEDEADDSFDFEDHVIDDNSDEVNDPNKNLRGEPDGEESRHQTRNLRSRTRRQNDISPYFGVKQQLEEIKRISPTNEVKRKGRQSKRNKEETATDGSNFLFWIIVLIGVIIGLSVGFYLFDGQRFFDMRQNIGSMNLITEWQTFDSEFESFERIYSEVIPIKGFKVLKTSVGKVMNRTKGSQRSHSSSPAILLLIASEDNQNILKCVERDFVKSLNKAYNEINPIVINGRQTDATDIVDKFDLNFRDQQKHTIIIENIESISGKDVMSLHQFTDHENAKYKDVVIVMTAINYQKYNLNKRANPLEMDSIASKLFQIKWKNDLPEEQSFALISRLTPSVVTIIGQTKDSYNC